MPPVLLLNPNLMKPPVTPVALDHIGQYLRGAGIEAHLLDLALAADPNAALDEALERSWLLVAATVRNVDDSFAASRDFCLARTKVLLDRIAEKTDAPLVLGGVAFSLFPHAAMEFCHATFGIRGEGEEPLARLARTLAEHPWPGDDESTLAALADIPGLLVRTGGEIVIDNPPLRHDLPALPAWRRDVVDNPRYLREGGQVGFETQRGCSARCAYCADPLAKGTRTVARTPAQVADELAALLARGVDVFHTCDAEFNLPREHALAVCHELASRGLGERIRWYAYAAPEYFDGELAAAMRRAGCVGVDFTADHADPRMIARLGRRHTPDDLRRTAAACKDHGLAFMFDLLLGGPGETRQSIRTTLDLMKKLEPDRVGTSLGVRLYPGTPLVQQLQAEGPLAENPSVSGAEDNPGLLRPVFYVEHGLGEGIGDFIRSLIAGDERFLFPSAAEAAGNYNYNDNSVLCEAIRHGARGAFWDVLRRMEDGIG